jgi:hypothetical protein
VECTGWPEGFCADREPVAGRRTVHAGGGIGGALASQRVASSAIISAPAVYSAGGSTFVAVRGRLYAFGAAP